MEKIQIVQLIHNPTAGDEEHSREALTRDIQNAGFECRYSSTKDNDWKDFEEHTDFVAVAGGDGTVRKVAKKMLKRKEKEKKFPLAVMALGTANNIAKTFDIDSDTKRTVALWKNAVAKKVDTGNVTNVDEVDFFLEGFGFGIFPFLMKEMKKAGETYATPDDELKAALKMLHKILMDYEPRQCKLEVDGTDHSGKFYMVEVMNIKSIGPNIVLAPMADPGDGEFEVVLVPEAHKEKFSNYLMDKLSGEESTYQFHTLKGKEIKISWDGCRFHADDQMLKLEKPTEVNIRVNEGALEFLVSG